MPEAKSGVRPYPSCLQTVREKEAGALMHLCRFEKDMGRRVREPEPEPVSHESMSGANGER